MHDSVWIENLTMLEVRDLIKAGKTTALILTGGIEENGPYLTTGKHNNVLKATGESIARALGNALVAPIVTLEPGNPTRPEPARRAPSSCRAATYKAVLTDMSNSLRSQGFKDVVHARRQRRQPQPDEGRRRARSNAEWNGSGAACTSSPSTTTTPTSRSSRRPSSASTRSWRAMHDDYYITAIIATVDTDAIRMPERVKAGKFVINGVPLAPIEKTIENGKKMVAFRTKVTVDAIRASMAAAATQK